MNRAKVYHVNPVCNKWEEENHKRNMERAIKSARSTVATYATGKAGASRTGKSRPASRQAPGQLTPPPLPPPREACTPELSPDTACLEGVAGQQPAVPAGIEVQVLDAMIERRLMEVLGEPLIQRIQQVLLEQRLQQEGCSLATQCQQLPAGTANQTASLAAAAKQTSANLKGTRHKKAAKQGSDAAAVKPPRGRPQWDDDWAAAGPPRPLCAGAFPLPPTSRTARNHSPSRADTTPRPSSVSPYKVAPANNTKGGAGKQHPARAASSRADTSVRVQLLATSSAPASGVVNVTGAEVRSGTPASPATCTRYGAGVTDTAADLTASHVATIVALNPNTATLQTVANGNTDGGQSGLHPISSSQHTVGGEDLGLMSLSRLSSAHHNKQVASSTASSLHTILPRRFSAGPSHNTRPYLQADAAPAACANVQQAIPECAVGTLEAGCGEAGQLCDMQRQDSQQCSDVYSDDFEIVEEVEGSGSGDGANEGDREAGSGEEPNEHVRAGVEPRRRTVHELQKSVAQLTQLVQTKIQAVMRASQAQSQHAGAADAELDDMQGTFNLMGEHAQLGASSDLLAGSQLLTSAELEYLAQLGGGHSLVEQEFDAGDLPAWVHGQEMEAGVPTGTGHGWGDQHASIDNGARTSDQHTTGLASQGTQQAVAGQLQAGTLSRTQAALARLKQQQEQEQQGHLQEATVMVDATEGAEHAVDAEADSVAAAGMPREDDHVLLGTVGVSSVQADVAAQLSAGQVESDQGRGTDDDSLPVDAFARVLPPRHTPPTEDAGLAGQVVALWDSLRQLHHLMSGPRGPELSRPGTAQQVPLSRSGFMPPFRPGTSPAICLPGTNVMSQPHSPQRTTANGPPELNLGTVPEDGPVSPTGSCQVLCVEHATPDGASAGKCEAATGPTWSDGAEWSDEETEYHEDVQGLDGDLAGTSPQYGFGGPLGIGQQMQAASRGNFAQEDDLTSSGLQQVQEGLHGVGMPGAADHVWMTGLMHTLSRSLGGEELLQEMMAIGGGLRKL